MNTTICQLFDRKSVRAFTEKIPSEETKALILDSALQAPTAGNQILYTILDIDDTKLKQALSVSCDHQPFIATAPWVLIFLADCRRWLECYRYAGAQARDPGPADLLLACGDALIAAQNTVVAAESLGIGSCYIGDIVENREEVQALLHLDRYVVPAAMLVFGYPTEQQQNRAKPRRFDRRYIVQKNTYSLPKEAELRKMYREQTGDLDFDFDTKIKAFCKRKYMSDFAAEMNRSVEGCLQEFRTGRH